MRVDVATELNFGFSVKISQKNWLSTSLEKILATDNRLGKKSAKNKKKRRNIGEMSEISDILAKN